MGHLKRSQSTHGPKVSQHGNPGARFGVWLRVQVLLLNLFSKRSAGNSQPASQQDSVRRPQSAHRTLPAEPVGPLVGGVGLKPST
ncbi:unnamed protein product [Lota lota]